MIESRPLMAGFFMSICVAATEKTANITTDALGRTYDQKIAGDRLKRMA
jgi:hypothetical protein